MLTLTKLLNKQVNNPKHISALFSRTWRKSGLVLKLHDAAEAVVREGFEHGAAGLLGETGHPVVVTAVLLSWVDVHRISRVDGRVLIKVVVGPQQDPPSIAHCHCVGDVLGVGNVEKACGHPGNQVLQACVHTYTKSHTCLQPGYPVWNIQTCLLLLFSHADSISTHLVFNAFVVFNVLAEVNSRSPHVVLTVQTAAGLLSVLMLGDGNFVPADRRNRYREREGTELPADPRDTYIWFQCEFNAGGKNVAVRFKTPCYVQPQHSFTSNAITGSNSWSMKCLDGNHSKAGKDQDYSE